MLVCFITWISLEIYIINDESGLLLACDGFLFFSNSYRYVYLSSMCIPLQGELGVREGVNCFGCSWSWYQRTKGFFRSGLKTI